MKTSASAANERLLSLVNRGYQVLHDVQADYGARKQAGTYSDESAMPGYEHQINEWANAVVPELSAVFPTELEQNLFLHPEIPFGAVSGDYRYASTVRRFKYVLIGLDRIRRESIPQYTDLPLEERLYVEDIDSFFKVRDVNPAMVADLLRGGYLDLAEDDVQRGFEQILEVSLHRKDWGGEINDLYTSNVVVSGVRRATAFLLKGRGIGRKEMTISDCGKNGDQLVRLFMSPAELFVVQYVGPVADLLVKDVQGKVSELRAQGKDARFMIMDGQDTARVLHAYGKL